MEKPRVARAVARALVFAAWADGQITVQERDFLESTFKKMSDLQKADRDECLAMITFQPLQSEALLAFKDLRHATATEADREFALDSIHGVMEADGVVSPEEVDFIQTLDRIINGNEEAFYAEMSRVLKKLHF